MTSDTNGRSTNGQIIDVQGTHKTGILYPESHSCSCKLLVRRRLARLIYCGQPGWGEISSITLPTGALVNYTWQFDQGNSTNLPIFTVTPDSDWILTNRPVKKELTYLRKYDGTTELVTETWQYEGASL